MTDHDPSTKDRPGPVQPGPEQPGPAQPDPDITRDPDGTPKENPSGSRDEDADTASGGPADPPD